MILEKNDLKKLTSSEHINDYSIGVTLADVKEFTGTPTLAEGEVQETKFETKDPYNGQWRVRDDVYLVKFNENLTLQSKDQFAMLYPHPNLVRVGATIYPRIISKGESQIEALLKAHRGVHIDPETPIGLIVVREL